MTMYRLRTADGTQDGKVWVDQGQWKYYQSNAAEAFTVNEWTVHRMVSAIPRGAIITSAIWQFNYTFGKNKEDTVPQTVGLTTYLVPNHPPLPRANDTYLGTATSTDDFPMRPSVRLGGVTSTINYTVVTPGVADIHTVDITSAFQALHARSDYQPGANFALIQKCTSESAGSDLGIDTGSSWIDVTFTVPETEDRRTDVNMELNSGYEVDTFGADPTNTAFGQYNIGTITSDATRAYKGAKSLKFSTPVADGKQSHVIIYHDAITGEGWAFTGMIYVPGTIPADNVWVGYTFGGFAVVPQRDQWVAFCVPVVAGGNGNLFPHVVLGANLPTGTSVWIDEVCMQRTTFPQPPFTGNNPDDQVKDYKFTETVNFGPSVRETKARTWVKPAGAFIPRRKYVRDANGLWINAEPQLQTRTIDELGAATIDSLGATAINEL